MENKELKQVLIEVKSYLQRCSEHAVFICSGLNMTNLELEDKVEVKEYLFPIAQELGCKTSLRAMQGGEAWVRAKDDEYSDWEDYRQWKIEIVTEGIDRL